MKNLKCYILRTAGWRGPEYRRLGSGQNVGADYRYPDCRFYSNGE